QLRARLAFVVDDPARDDAPGLEPDGERARLVSLDHQRAGKLPPGVKRVDAAGPAWVESLDLEGARIQGSLRRKTAGAQAPGHGPGDRLPVGVDDRPRQGPAGVEPQVERHRLGTDLG